MKEVSSGPLGCTAEGKNLPVDLALPYSFRGKFKISDFYSIAFRKDFFIPYPPAPFLVWGSHPSIVPRPPSEIICSSFCYSNSNQPSTIKNPQSPHSFLFVSFWRNEYPPISAVQSLRQS